MTSSDQSAPPVLDAQSAIEGQLSLFDDKFKALVDEALERWHLQGIAVAVVDGDQTYTEGYGVATEPNIPVTPDTLFYTGSTTKSFTGAIASLLVDDTTYPDFQWSTPLCKLIRDDFVLVDDYATMHTTLEDALSHRTGLPGHTLTFAGKNPKETVRNLRHLFMNTGIRMTWQYCNLMYIAISHVIQTVTGKQLGDIMKEKLWAPLGMDSTFFSLDDAKTYVGHNRDATLATGYFWHDEEKIAKAVPHCDMTAVSGAGAIISTVKDYAKYLRSMMNQDGPLSKRGYAELINGRSIVPPGGVDMRLTSPTLYGLGWFVSTYHGETIIMHPGGLDGFNTTMAYLPDRKWGVVTMCNTNGTGRDELAWHLINEKLGVSKEKRLDIWTLNGHITAAKKQGYETAPERLYPGASAHLRSLSRPLTDYAGTYTHPAYPTMTIRVQAKEEEEKEYLKASANGSVPIVLNLRHATAEYFTADVILYLHGYEPFASVKAEFKLDIKGMPSAFGVALEILSGCEELVWFTRSYDEQTRI